MLVLFILEWSGLKVLSGQSGSAWEWYHWIGLKKDTNRYTYVFDFLILILNIWETKAQV